MRVATVDGLVTLFYDGSKELYNQDLIDEWWGEHRNQGRNIDDYDDEGWEEWDLSDGCKSYWKERLSWQQIIVEEGVTEIPEFTFCRCKNIKRVIFANTVIRIREWAFRRCYSLSFIKLSINIKVVEIGAFCGCDLISGFIPPRCREIGNAAFRNNDNLTIFDVHSNVQLGNFLFSNTKMMKDSPFSLDRFGNYYHEEEVHGWLKNINNDERYSIHRAFSSYQPLKEVLLATIRQEGLRSFTIKNEMGITPSRYLEENPFAEITEKEIIHDYIINMMGEWE